MNIFFHNLLEIWTGSSGKPSNIVLFQVFLPFNALIGRFKIYENNKI